MLLTTIQKSIIHSIINQIVKKLAQITYLFYGKNKDPDYFSSLSSLLSDKFFKLKLYIVGGKSLFSRFLFSDNARLCLNLMHI